MPMVQVMLMVLVMLQFETAQAKSSVKHRQRQGRGGAGGHAPVESKDGQPPAHIVCSAEGGEGGGGGAPQPRRAPPSSVSTCDVRERLIGTNRATRAPVTGQLNIDFALQALTEAIARRALDGDFFAGFNAQAMADTAWAFGRLGVKNQALMAAVAGTLATRFAEQTQQGGQVASLQAQLATFNAQNLANFAWAFATLGIQVLPARSFHCPP